MSTTLIKLHPFQVIPGFGNSDLKSAELEKLDVVKPNSEAEVTSPSELAQIRTLIEFIVDRMKSNEAVKCIEDEWKALALVLDRIFFWVTAITAVIMIPTFLTGRSPVL